MKKSQYLFPLIFLIILIQNVSGQVFHNLNFQELCEDSKTGICFWDVSWGGTGAISSAIVDKQKCLRIKGEKEGSVGFSEQVVIIDNTWETSIIKISSLIKSDGVSGKGAGLNIGLYDDADQLIANKDMGGVYSLDWVTGINDWKHYTISIVAPQETVKIKIGAILYGKGSAYFKDYQVSVTPILNRQPSKLAREYIAAACDTIKMHSLFRDSLDIAKLKDVALSIANDAQTYQDCHLAVNYLLESIRVFGDNHSFFMNAIEIANWESEGSQVSKIEFPTFDIIDRFGYILVPAFHGGNESQILDFADSLQRGIEFLTDANIAGWIVDLRQNTGGNMAPMVAGLGPLFDSERLGALIDVNGHPDSWYYKNGQYYWDRDTGFSVSKHVKLTTQLPIAVLTSAQTGSSGEAVLVSFIGNSKTKIFGQPTWGLTTGNGNFRLKDSSEIFLASTIYSDRNGKTYHGRIYPDFIIEDNASSPNDAVIEAAMKWILEWKD